jgi:hypothetical protein
MRSLTTKSKLAPISIAEFSSALRSNVDIKITDRQNVNKMAQR